MPPVPSFTEGQDEVLAPLLGECGSGSDITCVLSDRGLVDESGESTKWRRLYCVFLNYQRSGAALKAGIAEHGTRRPNQPRPRDTMLVMARSTRVQAFSSFEEENTAEHRRLARMSPEERLRELAALKERRWGRDWGKKPMVRRATWERVDWLD